MNTQTNQILNFLEWDLSPTLLASLDRIGIKTPTPVQQEAIPLALQGADILASAQTGTGKTIAYLIPLIQQLTKRPETSALIVTPTRELAVQVHQALQQLTGSSFKATLLIGGVPMSGQLASLKKKPRVIVGTPGRINDHLQRGSLHLKTTHFLVIDEADRMLDMGFGVQLDEIAKYLPKERQTLLFSATFLPNIARLSERFLNNPHRIAIDTVNQVATKIQQEEIHVGSAEKKTLLLKALSQREGSIIIFVKTRRKAKTLSRELKETGHSTDAIHGDLRQRSRDQVIASFKKGTRRILVATDVASRGLDIPHVKHVINYDLPECPEDYVHRLGRTGRAGAEGFALSLISPEDTFRWKAIHRLLNPQDKKEFSSKPSKENKPVHQKKRSRPFKRHRRRFKGGK